MLEEEPLSQRGKVNTGQGKIDPELYLLSYFSFHSIDIFEASNIVVL